MTKYKPTQAPDGYQFPTIHNYVCLTCGYEVTGWSHPIDHKITKTRTFSVNGKVYQQEYEISCGRFEEFSKKLTT